MLEEKPSIFQDKLELLCLPKQPPDGAWKMVLFLHTTVVSLCFFIVVHYI